MKHDRINAIILACAVATLAPQIAHAQTFNFVIGADSQYGYYSNSVANSRTTPTMYKASQFLQRCTNCTRIFFVAGDLVHDNSGEESTYGEVHTEIESNGVKVFDGLGNHDTKNFNDDWVSFDSRMGLYHFDPLDPAERAREVPESEQRNLSFISALTRGWSIYHAQFNYIDLNESGPCDPSDVNDGRRCGGRCKAFRFSDSYYCANKTAWYYAVGLNVTPSIKELQVKMARLMMGRRQQPAVKALVVQLHNYGWSKSAVRFLESLRDKLRQEGLLGLPIILVAHQRNGSVYQEFQQVVADLNVVAFLHGHDNCSIRRDKTKGHCDSKDTYKTFTSTLDITNRNGVRIPSVNTNAIFHNIYWAVSLNTDKGIIGLKRLNTGNISIAPAAGVQFRRTPFNKGFVSLLNEYHYYNSRSHNFPIGKSNFYVCNYVSGGSSPCSVGQM